LTGEPWLALAFMDRAAAKGILSQAFRDCLNELYGEGTPRPRHRGAKAKPLTSLNGLFGAIQSVDVPPRRARFESLCWDL